MVDRQEPSKVYLIKGLSSPHCFWMAQQTLFVFLIFILPFILWIASLPFEAPDFYSLPLIQNDLQISFFLFLKSLICVDSLYLHNLLARRTVNFENFSSLTV